MTTRLGLVAIALLAALPGRPALAQTPAPRKPAVPAAPTAPAAPARSAPVPAPRWDVGDSWTYAWDSPRGKGTFTWVVERVETIDGTDYHVVSGGSSSSAHLLYYRTADLAYLMDVADGDVEVRVTPPQILYAWPLAPGATWEQAFTVERPKNRTTEEIRRTCKVEGEETVAVPAGSFETLRVTCRNVRTGRVDTERWYAPQVRHVVRERLRYPYGVLERRLQSFKPGLPRPIAATPGSPAPPPASPAAPPGSPAAGSARGEFRHHVAYRVTGSATEVTVTYRNDKGGTQQGDVRLPWEATFDLGKPGVLLYVSAQNRGVSGSVTCEILVDGVSRTNATSTGAYVMAECSEAMER
jgi:hypothetical protein